MLCAVMNKLLLITLLVGLAACGSEPAADAPPAPGSGTAGPDQANEAVAALPDADINASLGMLGEAPGAPGSDGGGDRPRFVGRWAAEAPMCETAAWRFTERELTTPAGSVCRFEQVREAPGGYDIAARCTAEGPEEEDGIAIRFAESADAMLFESGSIADAGLVRCED